MHTCMGIWIYYNVACSLMGCSPFFLLFSASELKTKCNYYLQYDAWDDLGFMTWSTWIALHHLCTVPTVLTHSLKYLSCSRDGRLASCLGGCFLPQLCCFVLPCTALYCLAFHSALRLECKPLGPIRLDEWVYFCVCELWWEDNT